MVAFRRLDLPQFTVESLQGVKQLEKEEVGIIYSSAGTLNGLTS